MKLYQSVGPNPRVATMFIAEKGLAIERVWIDIQGGENREAGYLAKNPQGGTPTLELDDGSYLPDSMAICEYLEELFPADPLIGATPADRAATRKMARWVDHQIVVPMVSGFRSAEGLPMFKDRMLCIAEAADANKAYARDGLAKADAILGSGDYLTGARFTLADILLFCFVEFGAMVGQPIPAGLDSLGAWRARIAARSSSAISADPKNGL